MKKPEKPYQYSYQELSAFCLQIGLLLEAAVPLDEGLAIMAEDAGCEDEKQLLLYMAEGAELGDPFFKVLEDAGTFPLYVVRMAKLGQQSGTLDQMMKSLSDYYEKEYRLLVNVKNALTYPIMMVVMLLVVLFVLFSKEMCIRDSGSMQVNKMHKHSAALVKASAQAQLIKALQEELTEEELAAYKRGRNAKSATMAKHATMIDYRMATGLEALVGWLFLTEQYARLVELVSRGDVYKRQPDLHVGGGYGVQNAGVRDRRAGKESRPRHFRLFLCAGLLL